MAAVWLATLFFFTTKHNSITFGTLFNDSMQTVYVCGSGGGGSQQREVANGADVVFTDTVNKVHRP